MANKWYVMTLTVLLSAFNTICSGYWPLDSILRMYRHHRTDPNIIRMGQFQRIFYIFWSIYLSDQLTISIHFRFTPEVFLLPYVMLLFYSLLVKYCTGASVRGLKIPRGVFSNRFCDHPLERVFWWLIWPLWTLYKRFSPQVPHKKL